MRRFCGMHKIRFLQKKNNYLVTKFSVIMKTEVLGKINYK